MSGEIILDLCGGTSAWSRPYAEAGYDVRNITLPDYDVRTYEPPENVHGILAAPPCTMFSTARTTPKVPRDLRQGMETVIACLNIIWKCSYDNKPAFWCLENPRGMLRRFLGKPAFTFDPCDFGDPWTKKTNLWGCFREPKKNPVEPEFVIQKNGERMSKWYRETCNLSKSKGQIARATTPSGFAKAFFEANP